MGHATQAQTPETPLTYPRQSGALLTIVSATALTLTGCENLAAVVPIPVTRGGLPE